MSHFRKINTEEYVGGRGHATGHARSEKRRGGRIKCSAMKCDLGTVEDHTVRATCVWIRVDDHCEFEMGWELPEVDAATRKRLMELAATAQDSEGMSRGWSPMKWWRKAG
jgi:hypothetical protein